MYLNLDRLKKLEEAEPVVEEPEEERTPIGRQGAPKYFGQYWNSRKAKRRGGARRK